MKDRKGEYVILRDTGGYCYTTNSIFWYCFFTDRKLPGTEIGQDVKIGEKTDWDVVTHNGEIVHKFKDSKDNMSSELEGGQ